MLEVGWVFDPLVKIYSPQQLRILLSEIGIDLPVIEAVDDMLENVIVALASSGGMVELSSNVFSKLFIFLNSDDDETQLEAFQQLIEILPELFVCIEGLATTIGEIIGDIENIPQSNFNVTDEEIAEIGERLVALLLSEFFRIHHPRIYSIFNLLGVIEKQESAPHFSLHLERFEDFINDPAGLFRVLYGWGDHATGFNSLEFLSRLQSFFHAFSIPSELYPMNPLVRSALGEDATEFFELRAPFFRGGAWPNSYGEVGLNLSGLPELVSGPGTRGLMLAPYFAGSVQTTENLNPNWQFILRGGLQISDNIGVSMRPPHKLKFEAGIFDSPLENTNIRLEAQLTRTSSEDEFFLLFGNKNSSRFGFRNFRLLSTIANKSGVESLSAEIELIDLTLNLSSGDADNFIGKLLNDLEIEASCDLAIGWANDDGVYFRGSGALEIKVPLHRNLGPLSLDILFLEWAIGQNSGPTIAISFGVELGPIKVAVNRIGIRINGKFVDGNTGSLGPLDLERPQFKPPSGAGFSVDAEGLVGGGFIDYFEAEKRYSGALALQFGEIGITAIGLITTQLPDGADGFSLLVSMNVTFDPGIQIYMGFTLSGVGGLIGINRSMRNDVLREGLKKGTLDSILFPDPASVIANANQIISDMQSVFPAEDGRFVVGPMLQIGWGTPTMMVGELGVFLEFNQSNVARIVLMGQVVMSLPDPELATIGVNIDVLGTLDLEKKELSFQAAIYGSSLMAFEIYGDCALMLNWGAKPEMGLAIGGFHPAFDPPPPPAIFSGMRQLTLTVSYGPLIELGCRGYLAVTPNSLQFGARVDVMVGLPTVDVGIRGFMSFDALFYFSPFGFEVRMAGGMAVTAAGFDLANLTVRALLAGPTPWNLQGSAKIKIVFVDIDIGFDVSWGSDATELPQSIDPWVLIEQALRLPESWGSLLPAGALQLEALSSIAEQPVILADGAIAPRPLVLHPAGTLEVRQNVAPLETSLSKFGSAPIHGYDRFRIDKIVLQEGSAEEIRLDHVRIDEYFARSQFQNLPDHMKLSLPSFEQMPGGVTTRAFTAVKATGGIKRQKVMHESILIASDLTSKTPEAGAADPVARWEEARFLLAGNARSKAEKARGQNHFAASGSGLVDTVAEKFVVVDATTLQPVELDLLVDVPQGTLSRMQADQALAQQVTLHPDQITTLMVVSEFEVEEAA